MMTVDAALTVLAAVGPLIPYPPISALVPVLIQLARDLEASGVLDTSTPVDLSTIGQAHRAALQELIAELAKHQGGNA